MAKRKQMSNGTYPNDTTVRCFVCKRTEETSFEYAMRNASWPACHGQTMEMIETSADIDKIMNKIFSISWRKFSIHSGNRRRVYD